MARTARILCDGGVYHILNRGHNKQTLFYNVMDYAVFRKFIRRYLALFEVDVYNYIIMPNHFHLLLKTAKSEDLPRFMKGLCQTYAQYHRKKYNFVGYLFQNRYKSILIKDDTYLLECARYIERNPLRANLVDNLNNYPYLSYHYYSKGFRDSIITPNPLYMGMGASTTIRRRSYIEYIHTPRPYEEILDEKLQMLR